MPIVPKALENHDNGELPKFFFKLFEDSNSDVYMTGGRWVRKMGFEVSPLNHLKFIECSDFYVRKAAVG
jgi:hypothetical protein